MFNINQPEYKEHSQYDVSVNTENSECLLKRRGQIFTVCFYLSIYTPVKFYYYNSFQGQNMFHSSYTIGRVHKNEQHTIFEKLPLTDSLYFIVFANILIKLMRKIGKVCS